MIMKIEDFAGFFIFFLAYCVLFLGPNILWVIPSGLVLTYILTRFYYKWINPPKGEETWETQEKKKNKPSQ